MLDGRHNHPPRDPNAPARKRGKKTEPELVEQTPAPNVSGLPPADVTMPDAAVPDTSATVVVIEDTPAPFPETPAPFPEAPASVQQPLEPSRPRERTTNMFFASVEEAQEKERERSGQHIVEALHRIEMNMRRMEGRPGQHRREAGHNGGEADLDGRKAGRAGEEVDLHGGQIGCA